MLSNVSIQKFLDSKDLIITPWHPEMMRAAGVSLHLGNVILIPKGNQVVDVKLKNVPKYEKVELSDAKPFPLTPNMFVLGETYEMVGLSEHIGMLLEGRSTLARLGITVVQTAMIIDTGMRPKKVTLEIHNKGPHTILLYPKMKFCRACIFHLDPPATIRYDTDGKYNV
ncbi:MAG: dCTP deaminase, partial [Candidatus Levyibacteriota bacterium]